MASTRDLHPELVARLERFLADPETRDRFRIGSTSRSYRRQLELYRGWLQRLAGVPGFRRFNLAADPDRVIGRTDEGWIARGSWHLVQEDGFAYAVDLSMKRPMWPRTARDIVDRIAPEYGLRRTVPSEWWHVQARGLTGWFHDPQTGRSGPVAVPGRPEPGRREPDHAEPGRPEPDHPELDLSTMGAPMRYMEDPNGSHVKGGERHPVTAFVTDDNETWVRQVVPKLSVRDTRYDQGPFEDVRFVFESVVKDGKMTLVGAAEIDTTPRP